MRRYGHAGAFRFRQVRAVPGWRLVSCYWTVLSSDNTPSRGSVSVWPAVPAVAFAQAGRTPRAPCRRGLVGCGCAGASGESTRLSSMTMPSASARASGFLLWSCSAAARGTALPDGFHRFEEAGPEQGRLVRRVGCSEEFRSQDPCSGVTGEHLPWRGVGEDGKPYPSESWSNGSAGVLRSPVPCPLWPESTQCLDVRSGVGTRRFLLLLVPRFGEVCGQPLPESALDGVPSPRSRSSRSPRPCGSQPSPRAARDRSHRTVSVITFDAPNHPYSRPQHAVRLDGRRRAGAAIARDGFGQCERRRAMAISKLRDKVTIRRVRIDALRVPSARVDATTVQPFSWRRARRGVRSRQRSAIVSSAASTASTVPPRICGPGVRAACCRAAAAGWAFDAGAPPR